MKNPRSISLSKDIGVYVRTDQFKIAYDKYQVHLDNFIYHENVEHSFQMYRWQISCSYHNY